MPGKIAEFVIVEAVMARTTSSDTSKSPEPAAEVMDANRLLSVAIADGAALREALLDQAGGAYSADQLAAVFGCTRQDISEGREHNRYFGVLRADDTYAYPKFQVTADGQLAGLRQYLDAFDVQDGWTQFLLLLSPSDRLAGRTPLDALRAGEISNALAVAASYGHEGA